MSVKVNVHVCSACIKFEQYCSTIHGEQLLFVGIHMNSCWLILFGQLSNAPPKPSIASIH